MLNYKLSTFLELCETKNYTKTAEKLHMTQPAVTQHIKYLEQYYGTKLFYYDEKKRLHLTDQGRLLRSYAQSVQADSEIIKNRLSVPINEPDVFKLGSLTGFGETFAAKVMGKYLDKYPEKKVSIYMGESDDLLVQLANGMLICGKEAKANRQQSLLFRSNRNMVEMFISLCYTIIRI